MASRRPLRQIFPDDGAAVGISRGVRSARYESDSMGTNEWIAPAEGVARITRPGVVDRGNQRQDSVPEGAHQSQVPVSDLDCACWPGASCGEKTFVLDRAVSDTLADNRVMFMIIATICVTLRRCRRVTARCRRVAQTSPRTAGTQQKTDDRRRCHARSSRMVGLSRTRSIHVH